MSKLHKQIVFVHLLNDYSGSPLVLSQVINTLDNKRFRKKLFISGKASQGFLSDLRNVETEYFWYKWKANPWLRLITYSLSQVLLFFRLLRFWNKDIVIYVNTLLPFGAALAGWLMRKKVIYHIHETSMKPPLLKSFLRLVANQTAHSVIHVSAYLLDKERLELPVNHVIYNTLSETFKAEADAHRKMVKNSFVILMLCSLKKYKGVDEFVALANKLPGLQFELVLNASQQEADDYFSGKKMPSNLKVFPVQKNVHVFYQRASLLLNLSHTDEWIETFGMTVLEAMYYGIPAIVPPIGGIAELVEHGKNGFLISSSCTDQLADHIQLLSGDCITYTQMSMLSKEKAFYFTGPNFTNQITSVVNSIYETDTIEKASYRQQYKSISS
jgi:L-malate glycosyltransferase